MKQQRSTKQRRMVLEAVRARNDHPSADQLYLDIRAGDPRISRGTVYRNLNLLAANGELRHVKVPGVDRFDWRVEPHYHLLCGRCGRVADIPLPYQKEWDREMAEQTGYEVFCHRTVFEGLCPECRQKEPEKPEE